MSVKMKDQKYYERTDVDIKEHEYTGKVVRKREVKLSIVVTYTGRG